MWLLTFFTGKPRTEVFLDIRLRHLKTHIRAVSPGVTGFETRDLSAKFARKLYDVFLAAQPVLGIYHALASDKAVRGAAYAWYVEQNLENAKKTVDDFVGMEEMEEIFAQTGQTEEIRKKLGLAPERIRARNTGNLHRCSWRRRRGCTFPWGGWPRFRSRRSSATSTASSGTRSIRSTLPSHPRRSC